MKFLIEFNQLLSFIIKPVNLKSYSVKKNDNICKICLSFNSIIIGLIFVLLIFNFYYYIYEESLGIHDSKICSESAEDLRSSGILTGSGISVYIKWHGIYNI